MSISLSATVALVCLYSPKIYILLFHPDKNVRKLTMNSAAYRRGIPTNNATTSGGGISLGVVGNNSGTNNGGQGNSGIGGSSVSDGDGVAIVNGGSGSVIGCGAPPDNFEVLDGLTNGSSLRSSRRE